jgi:LemA protein
LYSIFWGVRLYNRLVKLQVFTEEGWSGILAALKRRRDILPNLVETAAGYMSHENDTLKGIAQARALGQAARGVEEVAHAETNMMAALAGFRGIVENYPELKANQNMMHIKQELSALEERIEKTRRYYNATVRDFNMEIDRFPANLFVGFMGYKHAKFFDTDEKSQEVPDIKFPDHRRNEPPQATPRTHGASGSTIADVQNDTENRSIGFR